MWSLGNLHLKVYRCCCSDAGGTWRGAADVACDTASITYRKDGTSPQHVADSMHAEDTTDTAHSLGKQRT